MIVAITSSVGSFPHAGEATCECDEFLLDRDRELASDLIDFETWP